MTVIWPRKPVAGVMFRVVPWGSTVPWPTCTEEPTTRRGVPGKGLIVYWVRSTASVPPERAAVMTASETWVSARVEATRVTGTWAVTAPEPSSTDTVREPSGPLAWPASARTDRVWPLREALTPTGTSETW